MDQSDKVVSPVASLEMPWPPTVFQARRNGYWRYCPGRERLLAAPVSWTPLPTIVPRTAASDSLLPRLWPWPCTCDIRPGGNEAFRPPSRTRRPTRTACRTTSRFPAAGYCWIHCLLSDRVCSRRRNAWPCYQSCTWLQEMVTPGLDYASIRVNLLLVCSPTDHKRKRGKRGQPLRASFPKETQPFKNQKQREKWLSCRCIVTDLWWPISSR